MADLKIVNIKKESNKEIIFLLETLLEAAQNGEILSMAIVTLNTESYWTRTVGNPSEDIIRLIGALESLKTILINQMIEN